MPSFYDVSALRDVSFFTHWTRNLNSGAAGLSFARERGWLLAWDTAAWLHLLNEEGESEAQRHIADLKRACISDDGSALAAVSKDGSVFWLAPDLSARWSTKLDSDPLGLAIDPHGQYLAVSVQKNRVHFFDCLGEPLTRMETPLPIVRLQFVPAAPYLIGCADIGLVVAFNLQGDILWRDTLVVNVGGLSANADGKRILLSCFSDGLQLYDQEGKRTRLPLPKPCRLVAQTFAGERIVVGCLDNQILLVDKQVQVLAARELEKPCAALSCEPLGHGVVLALDNGPIVKLGIK